ncbi:MAG: nucleoside hydrolase [Trueperaceae bacterium]|nr:nucleoside hydrolase [Trueperaceae bacterium]
MRPLLIDTDTASDDAVALMMALREPAVSVEAVTVVAGNCPLETCVRNALIAVEAADTYAPPVHAGAAKPMLRPLVTTEFVHGADGLGDMNLPDPQLRPAPEHAVDVLIGKAHAFEGLLEVVTLGPLTNVAIALLRAPELARLIRHMYVMGGAGLGPGNMTPVAEYNFFADAEAAQVLMASGVPTTVVGWDVCTGEAFLDLDDVERLRAVGPRGRFAVRCNASLQAINARMGRQGLDLADPSAMAVALSPDLVTAALEAYAYVEHGGGASYGQFVIDRLGLLEKPPNVTICAAIDAAAFKDRLLRLLA